MVDYITIIGGGLAGSEAAYQIAKRGIKVKLYEMKPDKFTEAHSNKNLAEIVCSNSFKSNLHTNACGLLKEELRKLDSLLIRIADETQIPAGQALAVDRELFSQKVTEELEKNPLIEIIHQEVTEIEKIAEKGIVIIATGPLTSEGLSKEISKITGEDKLHFYDAAAPIVTKESIDFNIAFFGNRYEQEKGKDETIDDWKERLHKQEASYINLPMNKDEYEKFVEELINAEVITLHEFEKREIFEGCMPVEVMAKRGKDTLRYGPLKPVGFDDPRTGKRPYAVIQLRQDNELGTIYNIVGFQTNLKYGEQKRVFGMIPGLQNAEFVKYGVMHRNTYINSTKLLDNTYNFKDNKNIYFAVAVSLCPLFILSYCANIPASNVPEIECHTQDTAQIIADSGVDANWAVVVARFVANPAFCIPTSIEIVRFFAVFIPVSFPAQYPRKYPKPLCKSTATKITIPDWKNFDPCDEITPPTTHASPRTATPGMTF